MKNVPADQQERRSRILETTREQLAKFGYDGINMRDLAVAADVATTTLYNQYKSKDALVLAAMQEALDDLRGRLQVDLRGIDRFIARREIVADQIVVNPTYSQAVITILFAAAPSDEIVRILISATISGVRELLRDLERNGSLIDGVDINKVALHITASNYATILMWMKGFIALHDFKEDFVNAGLYVLKAVLKPGSRELEQVNARLAG